MVLRARQRAQFSCDSPPNHRFCTPEVDQWVSQRCLMPPQIGIAWPVCIMASPSLRALGSCTAFMVLRARQRAQFSCDSPPNHRFCTPEVDQWVSQRCLMPPQIGIAWPVCIIASPSLRALGSCTAFMVLRARQFVILEA